MPKTGNILEQSAIRLSRHDLAILRELAANARLSNVELARRVPMSESACLRRVRALEASGAIVGYRAVINPRAVGKNLAAYMLVNLNQRAATDANAFLDVINNDERITSCAAVTGQFDLILQARVRDVADLTHLTLDTLLKIPTVRDVVTCLSLRSYKPPDERV